MFGMTSGADWLIAGLGNPEPKYDGTRHNTGFAALDALAEAWGCEINKSKWQGLYGIAQVDGRKVMLLKPLTYMNLSGQSIAPAPMAGKQADDEAPGRVQHHDGRVLAFVPQQGSQHAHGNARSAYKNVRRVAAVFPGQKGGQIVKGTDVRLGQAGRGADPAGRHVAAVRRAPGGRGQPCGQPPGQGQGVPAQGMAKQSGDPLCVNTADGPRFR